MAWVEQHVGAIDRRGYLYCNACADTRNMPDEEYVYFSSLAIDDSCEACRVVITDLPRKHI